MTKTQRTITAVLWGLVVVSLLSLLAMQRWHASTKRQQDTIAQQLKEGQVFEIVGDGQLAPATQKAAPFLFDAPTFKLVDQDNKPFDSDSLRGKVWTASFFFSKCQGVCPAMMGRVKALQKVTDDPNVEFVYFTVDPSRDTPEVLHQYAQEANADSKRWHMLTGSDLEMKRIAAAFKLPYSTPAEHSGKILLVDPNGKVQSFYESRDNDAMKQLAVDVKKLAAGEDVK